MFEPVLFNNWLIGLPEPGPNPLIFPELPLAVQVKLAPVTWELSPMEGAVPEQMVCPLGVK